MIPLESPLWSKLEHAYGAAGDIPELLAQLEDLPDSEGEDEPWFSLWSALAHQGDVYSASFAAVPHVVAALARDPLSAGGVYFQFPAWVEICRAKQALTVPSDLQAPYAAALAQLPRLVAVASTREWDEEFVVCALAAVAAAKGRPEIAEAVLELTPEVSKEFMEWFLNR